MTMMTILIGPHSGTSYGLHVDLNVSLNHVNLTMLSTRGPIACSNPMQLETTGLLGLGCGFPETKQLIRCRSLDRHFHSEPDQQVSALKQARQVFCSSCYPQLQSVLVTAFLAWPCGLLRHISATRWPPHPSVNINAAKTMMDCCTVSN